MNLGFYQICWNVDQLTNTPEGMLSWDNSANSRPDLFEYYTLDKIFREKVYLLHDYCGAVSPKFESKCDIKSVKFLNWIKANPGYDLYIINPYPQLYQKYRSVWTQGEAKHHGVIDLTEKMLKDLFNYEGSLADFPVIPPEAWSFCNYWVGNKKFWETYLPFLNKCHQYCEENKKLYFQPTLYKKQSAIMFTFIIERLLTTFLCDKHFENFSGDISYLAFDVSNKS